MKIEAVTVCVDYSDYLAWTLPAMRQTFDRLVVVTSPEDERTKHLCTFYNVKCVTTDTFYKNDSKFNKAAGINVGLDHLQRDGWIVHLDADIWLPPFTRKVIEKQCLWSDSLYTIDRLMCESFNDWIEFIRYPNMMEGNWMLKSPFNVGSRLVYYHDKGYTPLGYFQLWNPKGSKIYEYPEHGVGADQSDVVFSNQFDRNNRFLIPDIFCIHLENEKSELGKNWYGRTTKPFYYDQVDQAVG
jgi:hypothetical protein